MFLDEVSPKGLGKNPTKDTKKTPNHPNRHVFSDVFRCFWCRAVCPSFFVDLPAGRWNSSRHGPRPGDSKKANILMFSCLIQTPGQKKPPNDFLKWCIWPNKAMFHRFGRNPSSSKWFKCLSGHHVCGRLDAALHGVDVVDRLEPRIRARILHLLQSVKRKNGTKLHWQAPETS